MSSENDNFREEFRHELNSRWTTEQLRELIESVNRERDRRYMDKFEALQKTIDALREMVLSGFAAAKEAVAAALVAAKELVSTSFEAAKEAITKSDIATEKRFESVNEFRSQQRDMITTLLPRAEADQRFQQLRDMYEGQQKQINTLQRNEGRVEGGATTSQTLQAQAITQSNWRIGIAVIIVLALMALIANFVYFAAR